MSKPPILADLARRGYDIEVSAPGQKYLAVAYPNNCTDKIDGGSSWIGVYNPDSGFPFIEACAVAADRGGSCVAPDDGDLASSTTARGLGGPDGSAVDQRPRLSIMRGGASAKAA